MNTVVTRALIVEDDRSWQQILHEMLTDAGLVVDVAGNLQDALRLVREAPHRMAVVDLSLAETDHRSRDGLRVLDDRSLNGVFVNGERVEWSTLADGDEVVIGRHHLHFIDVPAITGMRPRATSTAMRINVKRSARSSVDASPPGPQTQRAVAPARTWRSHSRSKASVSISPCASKGVGRSGAKPEIFDTGRPTVSIDVPR